MDNEGRLLSASALNALKKDDLLLTVKNMQESLKTLAAQKKQKTDEVAKLNADIAAMRNENQGAITNESLANVVQTAVTAALVDVHGRLAKLEKLNDQVIEIKAENRALRLATVQQQRFIEYLEEGGMGGVWSQNPRKKFLPYPNPGLNF